jgi:hypothetical protein
LQIPKIKNGNQLQLYPVVRITGDFKAHNPGLQCTGVFIAKDWIATAAHCMVYGNNFPQSPNGEYQYQIIWADASGSGTAPGSLTLETGSPKQHQPSVTQIPDPLFMGYNSANPAQPQSGPNDFALLWLNPIYESALPGNPNGDPANNQPPSAMMLSLQFGQNVGGSSFFWGWGLPNSTI